MADSVWILVPLLVLAAVLLLGFAGCVFEHAVGTPKLTLRATVPGELTVVGDVMFRWTRPGKTVEETAPAMRTSPLFSVDAYIAAALSLGPSLFWTLGSVNGLTDRSPNGRDGTPLGGVLVGQDLDGPTDFPDAAATLFDGTDDGIGSSYNPFVGTAARTFVGWARWDSGGGAEYTLFGSSAGDQSRPYLRVEVASRDVQWRPSGDDGAVVTWPAVAPPEPEEPWFMWVLRAEQADDKATLYIDGNKISEQPIAEPWSGSPGNFQAAIGATNRRPFKGAQGLVAVYERALTDQEVTGLYRASQVTGDVRYEHQIPPLTPQAQDLLGTWLASCQMTVQADSQTASGSDNSTFNLTQAKGYVATFHAAGSPLGPVFQVTYYALTEE